LHLGFPYKIIGKAWAGINNKSQNHHPEIVSQLKDEQQFIFFKKKLRHDTPLIFTNDTNIEPMKTCDAILARSFS
jgi:hypothetical protein